MYSCSHNYCIDCRNHNQSIQGNIYSYCMDYCEAFKSFIRLYIDLFYVELDRQTSCSRLGGNYKGHVDALAPTVQELANLEREAQSSFLQLGFLQNQLFRAFWAHPNLHKHCRLLIQATDKWTFWHAAPTGSFSHPHVNLKCVLKVSIFQWVCQTSL